MKQQTLGTVISALRKAKGMTQLELADKMNVTDKAVSKWERDISCPDIYSLPRLAEELGVSVDELMQYKGVSSGGANDSVAKIAAIILKAIPLAMGVCVAVLSILGQIDSRAAFAMLGIGLACVGISLLGEKGDE